MSSVLGVAWRYLLSKAMRGIALGIVCATYSVHSAASTLVAPVSAFATSNFDPHRDNFAIENTINQSGLSLNYISGVTDLDSYLAGKPKHTSNANHNEWFSQDFSKTAQKPGIRKTGSKRFAGKGGKERKLSNSGVTSTNSVSGNPVLSIIYGFSGPVDINGFVLWNEEFAGIGKTDLLSSIDGITYTLLTTITPTPSTFAPAGKVVPYLAQVFSFDLTTMLFFKLLIYDCPGPPANLSRYSGCGIGEVAFSLAPPGPVDIPPSVPLPAAFLLLGSALGLFVWMGRRRKSFN